MSGIFDEVVEYGPGGHDTSKPNNNVISTSQVPVPVREANERTSRAQLDGVFENLRTVANGTGTFANNTVRDAAIRNSARALVILIRLHQGKLDATD